MRVETVAYAIEGEQRVGQLAVPDGADGDGHADGPRPCVLVCHGAAGLTDPIRRDAVRLAELGYVTFALDYLGDAPRRADVAARAAAMRADRTAIVRAARAGLDQLLACEAADPTRVAALGYCFGGTMALELARDRADLRAAIGFHPSMPATAPEETTRIRASVLLCCGADDPYVPRDALAAFADELTEAGVADWRIELYGGVKHSFTDLGMVGRDAPGAAYDQRAADRSWRAAVALLAEVAARH
jgi:dienelactone hydrolase